jgi:hypothetical protein
VLPRVSQIIAGVVTAPPQPGDWTLTLQMEERGKPFKEVESVKTTVLAVFDADIERVGLPSSIDVRRKYNVAVRVRNSGPAEWSPDRVSLRIAGASGKAGDNIDDLIGKDTVFVPLAKPVPPGATEEFKFAVNAKLAGDYALTLAVWDLQEKDEIGKTKTIPLKVR